MDILPYDPLELVAIDDTLGVRRRWSVVAARDLFGRIVVETSWGRLGGPGRRLQRDFGDERAAARYVRALLARRATATRRLGVGYRALLPLPFSPLLSLSSTSHPG
ncbi:WGR domain-containing protein [Sphingomonas sp. BK069]|uniref:WGR domain-containing protein n=1 Tax=Sphingomonas sp. BK069 TaxID=2586979 RepID=UPI001846EA9D|nr:WGR domain-containing protein [Sphingomonas sp. BK069]MBB3349593.1 putative DNA-binding WGR domain protein [Sphingomonas sp. BK069]